jgi:uncharacterized protein
MTQERHWVAVISPDEVDASPAREPTLVHASFGRVRVHLPHWTGTRGEELVARLRRLRGVSHAEANPLTGNVLLRFDPQQTSAQALVATLPALRLEPSPLPALLDPAPAPAEEIGQLLERPARRPVVYATGARRVAYQALGWSSVGMAVVGAIVPGIPTAPFVVLASYFFVRSSPEAHHWLRHSRWFGTLLRDWEDHRGVRRSVRNTAVGLIGASMALTPFLGLPVGLVATIMPLQLIGLAIVLHLHVVEPAPAALAAG